MTQRWGFEGGGEREGRRESATEGQEREREIRKRGKGREKERQAGSGDEKERQRQRDTVNSREETERERQRKTDSTRERNKAGDTYTASSVRGVSRLLTLHPSTHTPFCAKYQIFACHM